MTIPATLLAQLRTIPGFDEASFLAAHEAEAVTSVRLHPAKGKDITINGAPIPWHKHGLYLKNRPIFTLDPAYHGGAYYVQEASSMFLAQVWETVVHDTGNLRVLDLCAAPGGKSTLLASLLKPESLLISNEVIRSRASILEENMVRWGYSNTWVTCNDPRDFTKLTSYFDVIVIDAPCSGSGLFRKDIKALHDWTEDNIKLCSGRQQRILADVWPSLKQGGIIIYATCSFSIEEDEQMLDWVAEQYNALSLTVPLHKDWGIVETESPERKMKGYRFFPGKINGEGFFIAAFQKLEEEDTLKQVRVKVPNMTKVAEQTAHLLAPKDWQYIEWSKDMFSAICAPHLGDWKLLQKALYFRKAGLNIGSPTAKEWLPDHAIALSIDANTAIPSIQVSKEQALQFLKREDFGMPENEKGWRLIKFNNLGLGWVKCLGNRANNYLPKHWRIRMEIPDDELL